MVPSHARVVIVGEPCRARGLAEPACDPQNLLPRTDAREAVAE